MAERYIDAAISDGGSTATFFLADHYVVYDFGAAPERVRDGVWQVGSFPVGAASGFPASFAPAGPNTVIDAAIPGAAPFAGIDYFFAGGRYMRFVRAQGGFDPADGQDVGPWGFPAQFATPDAAFNGSLNRAGFGYFFKGSQYLRYVWAQDRVDQGYPKPIANMVGMVAPYTTGVDAAVDGAGAFADASYLFRDENYLRFQWVNAGEPHVDGPSRPIRGNWTGLAEMLMAGKAKSNALIWLGRATALLDGLAAGLLDPVDLATVTGALLTHFHLAPGDARIATISATFGKVIATLQDSGTNFRFRTDSEAVGDGNPAIDAAYVRPFPPGPASRLNFTRNFANRSASLRIAIVIHESVHMVDPASATPQTHISEWYLTAAGAALFGLAFQADIAEFATRYDLMGPDQAIHNPASYAQFARHVTVGDTRELP